MGELREFKPTQNALIGKKYLEIMERYEALVNKGWRISAYDIEPETPKHARWFLQANRLAGNGLHMEIPGIDGVGHEFLEALENACDNMEMCEEQPL